MSEHDERPAFADADEGGDPTLKDDAPPVPADLLDAANLGVERFIGPYKLLHLLGEGGFGVVYLAEQEKPVRRRVALKIIKLGMDTRQVVARFEAERQALALMEHPHIAKVLDAGATSSGRPYFVMELVRGVPLTQYCDNHKLGTRARLELFIPICHAIQHAHQKGVIHRDIKPSNILVMLHDNQPVPKVIDFGIAKATDHRLTERTLHTELHRMIGTPEYMSPEQAEMSGLDIDTRTDIYSLGVVLYELLTGMLPFDRQTLRSAGHDEIRRKIREEEPPKPSTRVSTLADVSAVAARRGKTDPLALRKQLRGDLDWITMKAMEKDRTRRYETAHDLAAEVQRYLNDEPVLAGPPSAAYRLRKFIHRNRAFAVAGAVAGLALLLGLTAATYGFIRASQQRDRAVAAERQHSEERTRAVAAQRVAEEARAAEERQRQAAEAARLAETEQRRRAEASAAQARAEADKAAAINRFLREMLASADPANAQGREITIREVLDDAAKKVADGAFRTQPAIEADVRIAIGNTYRALGLLDRAEPHLRTALTLRRRAPADELGGGAALADALNNLGRLLVEKSDYTAAEPLLREALTLRRQALGAGHEDTAASLNNLAALLYFKGDYAGAEPLYREALALNRQRLGDASVELAGDLNNLAALLRDKGAYDEAETLYREALTLRRKKLGENHPATALSLGNLGELLRLRGDLTGAEPLLREALALRRKVLGEQHPDVAVSLNSLGLLLYEKNDYAGAEPLFREALTLNQTLLGGEHPRTADALSSLAGVLYAKGDPAGAEPLFRQALALRRKRLGDDHPDVANSLTNLARTLESRNNPNEAEPLLREALAIRRQRLGDRHLDTADAMKNLALLLLVKDDGAAAEPLCRAALAAYRQLLPPGHPELAEAQAALGLSLAKQKKYAAAEPLLLAGYIDIKDSPHVTDLLKRQALDRLVNFYETWDAAEPNAGHAEKAAQWRGKP